MYDMLSVGDATIDHFFFIHDASVQCDVNKEDCKLVINYADKLAVDKYLRFTAGNAMNQALSSALLGLKTAFYTVIGEDSAGKDIIEQLKKYGVATEYVQIDKENSTNVSGVISFNGERSILVYHIARQYQLPQDMKTKWMYLTSAGPQSAVPLLHEQVLKYLHDNPSVKLAFNPGTHQMNLGLEALKPMFARAEILFMNKEEYERVLGMPADTDVKLLMKTMYDLGVKICVLTDGPKGSYSYDGEKFCFLEIYDGPVVERTGSGDAYGAAFTAARAYDLSVEEAMRWGTFNSAYVIRIPGPQNGLLEKQEMFSLLKDNKNFRPKEI